MDRRVVLGGLSRDACRVALIDAAKQSWQIQAGYIAAQCHVTGVTYVKAKPLAMLRVKPVFNIGVGWFDPMYEWLKEQGMEVIWHELPLPPIEGLSAVAKVARWNNVWQLVLQLRAYVKILDRRYKTGELL